MKVIRSLGALLALLAIVVGAPIVLAGVGADLVPTGWNWPQLREVLLTPDTTGTVLVVILTVIGWAAWALFTLCVLVELVNKLSGTRIRLPGLQVGQKLAGGLVAAVFTISALTTTTATAAPTHTVTAPTTIATAAVAATPTPAKTTTPTGDAVHVVKAGDYLWKIAEEYYGDGAAFRKIARANSIDPFKDLTVGQKLTLPGIPTNTNTTPNTQNTPSTQKIPAGLPATVVVGPTDSLWGYAEEYLGDGDRWPEIWALNKDLVTDPDILHDGWTLNMPTPPQTTTTNTKTPATTPQDTKTPTTTQETPTQQPPPTTAPPTTADPQASAPAPTSSPQQVPDVDAQSPDEDAEAVPLAALAGVGLILTAGLITTLNRRRRRQLQ